MCLKNDINNTITLCGIAVGNVGKTLRSILFNLFIFIIGFGCGYTSIGIIIQHNAQKHPNYHNIQKLRGNMKRQHIDDNKIYLANGQIIDTVLVNMANEVKTNSVHSTASSDNNTEF